MRHRDCLANTDCCIRITTFQRRLRMPMATILVDKIYLNMTSLTYLRFGNPLVPQTHRTTTDDSAFRGNEIHDGQSRLSRKLNPWWSKPSKSATISIAHSIVARKYIEPWYMGQDFGYTTMPEGNALLRQGRDEVPDCTLSCPYRIMADCHCCCHYERLRLPSSARDEILLQQTLF